MATEVKLPRLGQGMESGTIVRWLVAEGEAVKPRDPLYELDTDKVTQEVEAEAEGVLLKILVESGEVDVGTTVALIGSEGEETGDGAAPAEQAEEPAAEGEPKAEPKDESEAEQPKADEPEAEEPEAEETGAEPGPAEAGGEAEPQGASAPEAKAEAPPKQQPQQAAPAAAGGNGARIKASPLARRIARERGVDLAAVSGTGPDGRVVAEDVERAATGAPAEAPAPVGLPPAEVEVVELTSIRKTIARRLTEAWQAPVFQLGVSADATELLALRERLVERLVEGEAKPTVNDVLTKLVAVALTRHRAVNAVYTGEEIHRFAQAHVGMAVAAPQGLVVPVVRNADRLTVAEIAAARADLVGRARNGKLTLADLEGGTFTISNLGMYGIEQFVAVLNPPQVAILAVGAAKETPVVVDGQIDVAPLLQLTLTCDHRAIDGADGAEFLQTLVAFVEQPGLAL